MFFIVFFHTMFKGLQIDLTVKRTFFFGKGEILKENLLPYIEVSDILRFLHFRQKEVPQNILDDIDAALEIIYAQAQFREVHQKFSAQIKNDALWLDDRIKLPYPSLQHLFKNSEYVYVVACTIGLNITRLIKKEMMVNPSHGVMLDACASMVADAYAGYIQSTLGPTTSRFSPGYGDVPLESQRIFAQLLQIEKNAGIHLTEGNLMIPEKSIIYLTGKRCEEEPTSSLSCNDCERNCIYRKA